MGALTTHGCGKSWKQRGNRTGHCSGCHETFEGLSLFDAHFDRSGLKLACRDPREMEFNGSPLEFDSTHGDGTWHEDRTKWRTRGEWGDEGATARDESDEALESDISEVER